MAAPRQLRKMAFCSARAVAVTLLCIGVPGLPIGAATTEQIVVDRNSGLAIHGFDPVAYFTDGEASLGKGEFEYRHAGVVWRFRNAGNRSAFAADPDIYTPQFGGYDPVGIGRSVPLAGDPRVWMIEEQRLYLFQSAENKAIFAVASERALTAAEEAWPALQRTLAP